MSRKSSSFAPSLSVSLIFMVALLMGLPTTAKAVNTPAASRDHGYCPANRSRYIGFRCVLSPGE